MELRIPEPFLQKHLEAFQIALEKEQKPGEPIVESVYRGYILKAAIDVGWADKCDIGELKPYEVIDISKQIQDVVAKSRTVPKN